MVQHRPESQRPASMQTADMEAKHAKTAGSLGHVQSSTGSAIMSTSAARAAEMQAADETMASKAAAKAAGAAAASAELAASEARSAAAAIAQANVEHRAERQAAESAEHAHAASEVMRTRERVSRIHRRYDAIFGMLRSLLDIAGPPAHATSARPPHDDLASTDGALDDAIGDFFSSAGVDPRAADVPAFAKMLQLAHAPSRHYRPPDGEQIRARLPPDSRFNLSPFEA